MSPERSVLFGKYCRSKRLVFSFVSRCQGVRITEINFHLRGYREGFVFGQFRRCGYEKPLETLVDVRGLEPLTSSLRTRIAESQRKGKKE